MGDTNADGDLTVLRTLSPDARPSWSDVTSAGTFRIELIDKEPVLPVGVVTTQPDRSPMFRITPR